MIATIKAARPDLLQLKTSAVAPIPETMPAGFVDTKSVAIEGIGHPTTACFITSTHVDPTNWWMFEKYDGVRGFWNPIQRAIYSRTGNKFTIPQEIIDSMPDSTFLDGELWFGLPSWHLNTC